MLVLSRHQNESIIIDGCIKVTVLEIRGDRIRLGIEAPREVPVLREELAPTNKRELADRRELANSNQAANRRELALV